MEHASSDERLAFARPRLAPSTDVSRMMEREMFKPKAKHLHPVEDIPAEIAALRAVGLEPSRVYYGQGEHAGAVTSVLFAGDRNDGWHALAAALKAGLG